MRRRYFLPTLLLAGLSLPAQAAEKSETIQLRYLSARELCEMLDRPAVSSGEPVPRSSRGIWPNGVVAWTADPNRNALVVTGTEEALAQLRGLVRLVDVPTREIRLSVRAFRIEAGALPPPGRLQEAGAVGPDGTAFAVLDEETGLAGETVLDLELTAFNARPLQLALPGEGDPAARVRTVVPRLNGDGTVTLMISLPQGREEKGEDGQAPMTRPAALRRLSPGKSVTLVPRQGGLALTVRVREVVRATPPAEK